jgi:hypothetical protein
VLILSFQTPICLCQLKITPGEIIIHIAASFRPYDGKNPDIKEICQCTAFSTSAARSSVQVNWDPNRGKKGQKHTTAGIR